MNVVADRYIELLHAELRELGKNGGILTPSIYDTAQVLRHAPPADTAAVVEWLLRQQQADGGWGDEAKDHLPRHVPTLASVLALREQASRPEKFQDGKRVEDAVQRGIDFLCKSAGVWGSGGPLPDDIPVAAELVLPMLLDEAARVGIQLPQEPFQALRALGNKRKQLIARMNPAAGTAPVHAWETWGTEAVSTVLDGSNGVGHSPSATAHWLRLRRATSTERSEQVRGAEQFLEQASRATGVGIPGVVPTVWPIDRFEQSWALFALYVLKKQQSPALLEAARSQFQDLRAAVKPEGIGMSDYFVCDGDITATTLALLADTGHEVDANILNRFMRDKHFITYAHELQPSVTTTAHALLAFAILGRDTSPLLRILEEQQGEDGTWKRDKWHKSWLYTTAQVLIALARAGETQALRKGIDALLAKQHAEGGWGFGPAPTLAETAYAVHALLSLKGQPLFGPGVQRALLRADQWMRNRERAPRGQIETYWIGKELYCPYRVDRFFELTAMNALESEREALVVADAAHFMSEFITSNNIKFERGDGNPLPFFTELGHWHYRFTLTTALEHAGTLVKLKNLYGLWNALVDDEIDQKGTRHQLDASLQVLLNRTRQGEPAPETDCDAVRTLNKLFNEFHATRPGRAHMLEAFHFDLWDLMNGFGYEYSINKLARLANSEEYSKYSTMTASIKHYLDLDCVYAAEYPSTEDYRHLRVGYEHLGRAIKFASDIGTLKRELRSEDNFNLVRILALESGLTEVEQRVENDEQYEALMAHEGLKRAIQEVGERAQAELAAARTQLERAPRVNTGMMLKAVTRFIGKYISKQDQLAPMAPTAPMARRSNE